MKKLLLRAVRALIAVFLETDAEARVREQIARERAEFYRRREARNDEPENQR
ncbi:MAG TPA: hypothetical protein VGQ38_15460 [Gaiellaceae bacterium]|jgi:hypothetical protein|nr:hypothetical protein [Gaiellaceae bacterium]